MGQEVLEPEILSDGSYTSVSLGAWRAGHDGARVVDVYDAQYAEWAEIARLDPALIGMLEKDGHGGDWIFYPRHNVIVHALPQACTFRLRTDRNRYLITTAEQRRLYDSSIAVIGLSIGAHFALNAAYGGFAGRMALADADTVSMTNLNRLPAGIRDIGRKKIDVLAERLYDVNPYQIVHRFADGIDDRNLTTLFDAAPYAAIFEAVDDFGLKVAVRLEAKRRGVPVIMLTNLGDNILVDVERYDTEPDTQPFHGLLDDDALAEMLRGRLTDEDKARLAAIVVGRQNVPIRAMETLRRIGRTAVGRPQLNSTVTMAGGLAMYLARRIILGAPLPSGRYHMSFASVLGVADTLDSTTID